MRQKRESLRWSRPAMASRVVLGLICLQCGLVSCGPVQEPTEADAVAVLRDYDVRRNDSSAWATWSLLGQFDVLTNGSWHALLHDVDHAGFVKTDETGQAELCDPGAIIATTQMCKVSACHIWVFEASDVGFGAYTCPESTLGTDLCSGGSLDLNGCEVCLTTLSADLCAVGTSFSVTYLWRSQVTIVTVDRGTVRVTPVIAVEGYAPTREEVGSNESVWKDLEVVRSLDQGSTPVEALSDEPKVYYTAPDAILGMIREVRPEAPPAREALSIKTLPFFHDELPVVLEEIGLAEPNLQRWISEISMEAALRGAPFPYFPSPSLGREELYVRAEDDLLANEYVQQAVSESAQRFNLQVFPRYEALSPGVVEDRVVVILFPAGDQLLAEIAETLYGQLVERGFRAELQVAAPSQTLVVDPGAAVISLGWR